MKKDDLLESIITSEGTLNILGFSRDIERDYQRMTHVIEKEEFFNEWPADIITFVKHGNEVIHGIAHLCELVYTFKKWQEKYCSEGSTMVEASKCWDAMEAAAQLLDD